MDHLGVRIPLSSALSVFDFIRTAFVKLANKSAELYRVKSCMYKWTNIFSWVETIDRYGWVKNGLNGRNSRAKLKSYPNSLLHDPTRLWGKKVRHNNNGDWCQFGRSNTLSNQRWPPKPRNPL